MLWQIDLAVQYQGPVPLEESECEKDLRVYVDQKMTFNRNVYEAIAKANRL